MKTTIQHLLPLCFAGFFYCMTSHAATDSIAPVPAKKEISVRATAAENDESPQDMDSVIRAVEAMRDSVENAEEEKRVAYALQTSHPKPQNTRLLFSILTLFAILISLMVRLYFYRKKKE